MMSQPIKLFVFFITLVAYYGPAVSQQNRPNAVLILDASRSMWGQIDNVSKSVIARNALTDSFLRESGKINLGIVAYGHRNAASCTDVQTIRKLRRLDGPNAAEVVNKVKPKGSTPISVALKTAAKQLTAKRLPKSIILLSDGLDNCNEDPCSTASALKIMDSSLRIHVVAFDRKKIKRLRALQCISKGTGGIFKSATSETELKSALTYAFNAAKLSPVTVTGSTKKDDTKIINLEGWKKVSPETTGANNRVEFDLRKRLPPKEAIRNSDTQKFNLGLRKSAGDSDGASGLVPVSLTALLNEGGLPITANLVWRIFHAKPDKKKRYKLVSTHREANPTAALAPGKYIINAAYGKAYLTKIVTVKLGQPINDIFIINAGGLRLASVLANGSPVPAHTVTYTVYSDERDQFGTRQKVISDAKPGVIIRLNAGIYHIVSRYGDANAQVSADVTIEPGKLTETTINHTAAKVTFKLVYKKGGEALAGTQWSILTPQGDIVKDSVGALPTHIIAAGNYVIMAKRDGQVFKKPFAVKPEETRQIELVIQ